MENFSEKPYQPFLVSEIFKFFLHLVFPLLVIDEFIGEAGWK